MTARPSVVSRPVGLRRSWLFVAGVDTAGIGAAPRLGADVLILDVEDSVPPARRREVRTALGGVLQRWRRAGAFTAVRINPLENGGVEDLAALAASRPDAILLAKAERAEQLVWLDRQVNPGSESRDDGVEIVPNVESALALTQIAGLAASTKAVTACLLASEDLGSDLGVERTREGAELLYARSRFLLECRAAGVEAIDCPYTWTDSAGLAADAQVARGLGYRAKSAVHASQVEVINGVLTPSAAEVDRARAIVAAWDRLAEDGRQHGESDGRLVERPIYANARRILERAEALAAVSLNVSGPKPS